MRVRLTKKHPYLTRGQEYEVLGLQGVSYRLLDDDGMPRLFERVHFETTETHKPSFWISQIGVNGEEYLGPKAWASPDFFDEWHKGVEKTVVSFWWDMYKLFPWTIQNHPGLPVRTRYIISVCMELPDAEDNVALVESWLKRWEGQVHIAYSDSGDGYFSVWNVEAPPEAIAELPADLDGGPWGNYLPFRRIQ